MLALRHRKTHRSEQTKDLSGGILLLQLVKRLLQRNCNGGPIKQPMANLATTTQSALILVPWLAGGAAEGLLKHHLYL